MWWTEKVTIRCFATLVSLPCPLPISLVDDRSIRWVQLGPRGEKDLSEELAQNIENLMLIYRICHKTIDTNKENYPVDLLRAMKREHEERIALASAIDVTRKSHIVMYGARVGEHSSPLSFNRVAPALRPEWYPADPLGILLGMANSADTDSEADYWANQERQLRRLVQNRIKAGVNAGEIEHISIFGIAPQPLLILLGYLLCDLVPAEVFQLHREPPT